MTYCVATLLDTGMVFLSDSRTNAGVDHINTFRKMHVFERAGDRVLVLMTAGNLAVSQAVVHVLHEEAVRPERDSVYTASTLFDAAVLVGDAVRTVHRRDAEAFKEHGIEFNASFILGEPTETVEDVYEPFLLQQGLLARTPRGRVATPRAYAYFGLEAPGRDSRLW